MSKQVSRQIGRLLKPLLEEHGIRCSKYPTISIIRTSPPGKVELAWTLRQLADCYALTRAYVLEMRNVEIRDTLGTYKIDYLSIVTTRENGGWSQPRVVSGLEDIYPGTGVPELVERAERFARKATWTIMLLVK
jgi:hypothetical protein